METNMKYFSMFSGIGGFELGIGDKGACAGYSEIDPYAIKVYEQHFPTHKNYGNATTIDADGLPDFDLLVGGFPCQTFSIAGKRKGFEDTRGTLFFDIARILRAKQPRNFVLENVKGLLSHDNGQTFKTIIATLAELGYCVEWQVLNSKNHGVPQNRERVYIVGHLGGQPTRTVFPLTETHGKAIELQGHVSNTLTARYEAAQATGTYIIESELNAQERHSNGSGSHTVQRQPLRFLKRNQKNIVGDYAFTVDSSQTSGVRIDDKIRRLTPVECERLQGFPDGWTAVLSDSRRYKAIGNAVTVNVVQAVMERLLPL